MKANLLPVLALSLLTFDAVAALRTRTEARQQTANITVSTVEVLEQFGSTPAYPVVNTNKLTAEIQSCGISYNGTLCLDSAFENFGNAGVKDVDTGDKSGYVFFSRFKLKNDPRILLMAVIANKSDCVLSKADPRKCEIDPVTRKPKPLAAFRTGNVWAITPGRDKPDTYIADFLKCTETEEECLLRPLIAYDPIRAPREEVALNDLEGISTRYADDFRRFFHAAQVAGTFTRQPQVDRAVRALGQRSELITKSGNATYRSAFFTLIQTKFAAHPELVADIAREVGATAAAGSLEQLQATMIGVRNGERSASSLNVLMAGYSNTRFSADVRKEALQTYARTAKTPAEKDKVIQLLGSTDQVLRSGAYNALNTMVLTEENLPAINKILSNAAVNVRGNAVKALSRVSGMKAMERMALMIKDKSVDVALSATSYLTESLKDTASITDVNFIYFMENTTIAATAANNRDRRVLSDSLIPARASMLTLAFGKVKGREQSMLTLLKASAANRSVAIRVEAISFIARLSIPETTPTLIGLLSDTNADVSAAVMKAMSTRLVTDEHVDLLFKISINPAVSVRRNAVALIGKVSSKKALQALLQKSKENIDTNSWKVRQDVAVLLGGVYTTEVTSALLGMMNEANASVRETAFNQLAKGDRLFDANQIMLLKALTQSANMDVVSRAVILLAQVNTADSVAILAELATTVAANELQLQIVLGLGAVDSTETTTLLISYLSDDDQQVRSTTDAALSTRTLTEAQLSLLGPALTNVDAAIRLLALKQIARSDSALALDLLSARLTEEQDETVRAKLQLAVDAIRSRQAVVTI